MNEPWRITLLGGLRAQLREREISRFSTQKTGALLAYLAFYRDRQHPREVLTAILCRTALQRRDGPVSA